MKPPYQPRMFCRGCGRDRGRPIPPGWVHEPCRRCGEEGTIRRVCRRVSRWPWKRGWEDRRGYRVDGWAMLSKPPEKVPGVENMSTPPRPSQPLSATTAAIHSEGHRPTRLAFLQDRADALKVEGVRGTDRWMGESVDRWEERLNELGHRGAPES